MGKPSRREGRVKAKSTRVKERQSEQWLDVRFSQNRWVFWLAYALAAVPILVVITLSHWLPENQVARVSILFIFSAISFVLYSRAGINGGTILYFYLRYVKNERLPSQEQ